MYELNVNRNLSKAERAARREAVNKIVAAQTPEERAKTLVVPYYSKEIRQAKVEREKPSNW